MHEILYIVGFILVMNWAVIVMLICSKLNHKDK